jgi:glycosyltransferase involved in cell wall biosynthesis
VKSDATSPLVSIVTASYNQGPYIERTIRSVLGQTYPRIEYIVMDGGSSDGTVSVLRKYSDRLGYWRSERDSGFAEAIAAGFRRSTGTILAWLNSDDMLAPDAVEKAVERLGQCPSAGLVYGNRVCIDENDTVLYSKPSVPRVPTSPIISYLLSQESCFWRREAYESVGGLDPAMRFAIDYDLFSRIARRYPLSYAPGVWGYFRKHSDSKTVNQYRTVGKQEVRLVQNRTWGGPANRAYWISGLMASRLYGLVGGLLMPPARWPDIGVARRHDHWKGLKTLTVFG